MRRVSAPLAVALLLISTLSIGYVADPAAADTGFVPVFSTNAPGDITYVANTVATCSAAAAGCAAAQAGGNSTNNGFGANMVLIDVDGDTATSTSSTATYTLPTGGSVLWAGLYWAGYYTGANGDKDDVKFSTPASGGYVDLTASFFDDWNANDNYYTGFVEVTSLVQAGGSGTYGVGDVAVTPGSGATYGGWTLIVVEADPNEPWRNLTVNHGFQFVGSGGTVDIPISGFIAPPLGPIDAEIGFVASEGDIGFAGDFAQFNGTTLSNATNPANNFFNSSLTDNGNHNAGMNPSYPANTLGFDADIIETSGLVPPGATSATVTIGTNGDGFFPTAVTTAIDIFVPNLTVNFQKDAIDLNGEDLHPGDVIEYTLSFDNAGQDPSIETTINDAIPAGTTYVPNSLRVIQDNSPTGPRTDAQGDDTAWFDGSAVNFNVGDGATPTLGGRVVPLSQGGQSYEVTFQVTVDAGTEGTDIINQAELNYIAEFINEPFSTTSDTTTQPVEPLVDLGLTKTDLADPVLAGDQLTYQLTIDNAGPSTAGNVVVTDTLPIGATFDAGASDPACSAVGQLVTCTYSTLAAGGSETPQIVVDIDSTLAETNICNPASVTSDTHEHDVDDNADRACTDIEREVDLAVDKDGPLVALAGDQFSYTIDVSNAGPSNATNVEVVDSLPAGATLISTAPTGAGACTSAPSCTWPTIAAGGSESVTVVVETPSATGDGTALTNRVEVGSDDPEADPADNVDQVTTNIIAAADLAVTKTTNTATVVAGGMISYEVSVTNDGPSDARTVTVTDNVPTTGGLALVFNPGSSSPDCVEAAGTVSCAAGTVADGDTVSFTLVFDIPADVADGASITNSASVGSSTDDPDPDNNDDTEVDTVDRQADLSIVKDDNTVTVAAGAPITYTISYDNEGPSEATGVVITDTLPTGVTFDSSSDCTAAGSTVTCNVGTVAAGASGSVSFTADTDPGLVDTAQLVNPASVALNETDPDPADNTSMVTTDVDRVSELRIGKDDLADPVLAGEDVTYTITVENLGPSNETGVVLTDALPSTLTFVATDDPTRCSQTLGTVTCDVGSLARGSSYTVEITATLDPSLANGTIISNTASAVGDFASMVDDTEETTVDTIADLELAKTGPPNAAAGTQITYTVTAFNDGPSDASNVTITDTLPAGTTLADTSVIAGTGACSGAGSTVTCTSATVAAATGFTVELTLDIDPAVADGTTITNSATVTSDTPDDDPADNDADADTLVTRSADLSTTKTTVATPVVAGTGTSFAVTVTNDGPSTATEVTVTDELPTGFTFDPGRSDSVCSGDGGTPETVTCSLASLAVDGSATFTVAADVDSDTDAGNYTNSATAASAEADPDPGNDRGDTDVEVQEQADLRLTKVADGAGFVPGATSSYTVTVSNLGPSDATAPVITDVLPAGLTFDATGSSSGCSGDGGSPETVTCQLGAGPTDLVAGTRTAVTISVDAAADLTGAIDNTASVSSTTPDPNPADNSDGDVVPATPRADLSVTKSGPGAAVAGQTATYDLVIANDGPSDAANTVVTDVLPEGMTFRTTGSDPACSGDGETPETVTCDIGTLAPTQSVNLTIVADIDSALVDGTTMTNNASVASDAVDPDPSDNGDTVTTDIDRSADLRIEKSASTPSAVAGTSFDYTIVVTNDGPSDADLVTVGDTLPAGVTAANVVTTHGLCTSMTPSIRCSIPTLADGASATITITVDVDPSVADATTLTNSASATSAEPDPDPDDNTDTVEIGTVKQADVSIEKSTTKSPLVAGESHPYRLTVANDGPSTATAIVVTDTIPAGTSLDPALSDAGCAPTDVIEVACDVSDLAPGQTITLNLVLDVPTDFPDGGTVTNSASVAASEDDPDPTDNGDDVTTPVVNSADLSVVKDGDGFATAGLAFTWTLTVVNDGPSDAVSTVITDTLPTGVTFDAGASDGRCSVTAAGPPQTVTCSLGTVEAGAGTSLPLAVDVDPGQVAAADLTNAATITSDTADPDPADNAGSDTAMVIRDSLLDVNKSDLADPVVAGGQVGWQIQVVNIGPSDAANVTIIDPAPAGVTLTAVDDTANCTIADNALSCSFATIADGDTRSVILTGDVDTAVADGAVLSNQVTADSDSSTPVTDTESTTVARRSDLVMDKTSDGAVVAGTNHTYELVITNQGPSDADNVRVDDFLPAGVDFVSATPSSSSVGCTDSPGTVTCDLGTIAAGASVTIEIVVAVTDAVAAPTRNTAAVTSDSVDLDPANNIDDDLTDVTFEADLSLVKRAITDPAEPGEPTIWEIEVTNAGPSIATGVEATDTLPPGLTFLPASSNPPTAPPSSAACVADGDPQVVTCTVTDLLAGESIVFVVATAVDPSLVDPITNSASASSATPDPDPDNNDGADTAPVAPEADLSVTKTAVDSPAVPGRPISYRISVTNDGPSDAIDVVVTDPVPAGATFNPGRSSSACSLVGANVICTVPVVPAGAGVAVTITFDLASDVVDGSTLTNQVSVTSSTPDPDPAGNQASDASEVGAETDLDLTKQLDSTALPAGEAATYLLTIANRGPSDATGVLVTDTLPAELAFRADGSDPSCSSSSGTVTCVLGDLAAGASVTVPVAVDVAPSAAGSITNSAQTAADTDDPNRSNDVASTTDEVARVTSLRVAKTTEDDLVAGDQVVYRITVENLGPADADRVVVTDPLPAGLAPVSATVATGGTDTRRCGIDGATVTCPLGTMAPQQISEVLITTTVAAGVGSTVTNVASVTIDGGPPVTTEVAGTVIEGSPTPPDSLPFIPDTRGTPPFLPVTGGDTWPVVAAALALIAAGSGLKRTRRQRRQRNAKPA